jgi:hypothetical protein
MASANRFGHQSGSATGRLLVEGEGKEHLQGSREDGIRQDGHECEQHEHECNAAVHAIAQSMKHAEEARAEYEDHVECHRCFSSRIKCYPIG